MQGLLKDLDELITELHGESSHKPSILNQRKRFHLDFWKNKRKTGPVSVVLLPLKSLTMDAEQEWFTDGMTEALITGLAKINGLRVISRASAMGYKGTGKTPRQIAAELGIHYVVEGSIVKTADHVKISARLVDAQSEEYAWAEEYERRFTNILGLQGEISRAIAKQIQIKLTPQEAKQLAISRSVNPETYEMYLKGMYHINKYTPDGIAKGLEYLHKAVDNDPNEPLAYAGLAMGYDLIAHSTSPTADALTHSRKYSSRALELDDTLAEAHYALAMVKLYDDWDWNAAALSFQRAIELKPSFALAITHYAIAKWLDGDTDEVFAGLYRAQKLDPLVPIYPAYTGWNYFWMKRYDEAILEAEKSLELVQNFSVGLVVLGYAYAAKGMFEQAIEVHQKLASLHPDFKWLLGHTLALAGHNEKALAIATEVESVSKIWETWGLAEIYTALDDKDKAFYWLEQAYEKRHPYIQWLKANCIFDPLSTDPRYVKLAKRMNLRE